MAQSVLNVLRHLHLSDHLAKTYTAIRDESVPCSEAYERYKHWCQLKGCVAIGERAFGKAVFKAFPSVKRKRAGQRGARMWRYAGIGLKSDVGIGHRAVTES